MDWVRTQIHETGAALTHLRNLYYPGPWAKLDDGGLDPGHEDDGPALEDCVGKFFAERLGELFAVLTDGGGHTWKDITKHLKPVTLLPPVRGADSGRRIYWLSSSQIYLLTRHGRVIESSDGGETWRQVVRFEEGQSNRPTGFYKLLFNAGGSFPCSAAQRAMKGIGQT